jgi:hypothetical protein
LLKRCLERDPAKRQRDLGDARLELDDSAEAPPAALTATPVAPVAATRAPWAIAAVALLLALAALSWSLIGKGGAALAAGERPIRFTVHDPPLALAANSPRIAIAPDGSRIFWVAQRGEGPRVLVTRSVAELETQEVAGSEGLSGIAAVAPDGSVAIVRGQSIEWLALRGGAPARQARAGVFRGAARGEDGSLWYAPMTESGIVRVASNGGEPAPIVLPDAASGERSFRYPTLLPGGEVVLFTAATAAIESFVEARIEAFSTRTKKRTVVVERASYSFFVAPDRLLFVRSGGLFEARLDVERLQLVGEPRLVQDGVGDDLLSGLADVAVANDGTLLYVPGGTRTIPRRLVEVGRDGSIRTIAPETGPYQRLRASPDGKSIVLDIDAAGARIWLIERDRGTRVRLTDSWSNNFPLWRRDGAAIYFHSGRGTRFHIFEQRLDGSAARSILESDSGTPTQDVSPDGTRLLFRSLGGNQLDLSELPLDGSGPPRPLFSTPSSEDQGRYSPDGRWLVFVSNETGAEEIYLQPLPGPGRRLRVTTEGGRTPVWTPDGKEIVFSGGPDASEIYAARLSLGADSAIERPRLQVKLDAPVFSMDMLPDGKLAVVLEALPSSKPPFPLVVARGWQAAPPPR